MVRRTLVILIAALWCSAWAAPLLCAAPRQHATSSSLSSDVSAAELVELLRTAHSSWRARLNVRGEYSLVRGMIRNRSDIFKPEALRAPLTRSRGFFAVAGKKLRVRQLFEGAAGPVDQSSMLSPGQPVVMRNIGTDEVYDGDTFFSFRPEQAGLSGTAQITRMMKITPSADGVRHPPSMSLHVLEPLISPAAPPGGMPGEPHPFPGADEYDIEWTTDSSVRLTAVFEKRSSDGELAYSTEHTAEWRLDLAVPMLTSYRRKNTYAQKQPTSYEVYVRDFCDSSELPFGRHVVTVHAGGFSNQNGDPLDLIEVSHWRSPNACEIAPTAEDFTVELPPGTSVAGLKGIAVTQKPTRVAIAALSDTDFLQPGDSVPETPRPAVELRRDTSLWLWVVNGAVLVMVAGYLLYRRLRRA